LQVANITQETTTQIHRKIAECDSSIETTDAVRREVTADMVMTLPTADYCKNYGMQNLHAPSLTQDMELVVSSNTIVTNEPSVYMLEKGVCTDRQYHNKNNDNQDKVKQECDVDDNNIILNSVTDIIIDNECTFLGNISFKKGEESNEKAAPVAETPSFHSFSLYNKLCDVISCQGTSVSVADRITFFKELTTICTSKMKDDNKSCSRGNVPRSMNYRHDVWIRPQSE
jgi:hypothetical protein